MVTYFHLHPFSLESQLEKKLKFLAPSIQAGRSLQYRIFCSPQGCPLITRGLESTEILSSGLSSPQIWHFQVFSSITHLPFVQECQLFLDSSRFLGRISTKSNRNYHPYLISCIRLNESGGISLVLFVDPFRIDSQQLPLAIDY
jgi:hypothetical protein